ncbi:hypothetical protein SAMN05421770_11038 [Granulicella rosea]|uniref:Uncharacterized protein n=1 Tax=Granulicella rosea TaxID=474952 RepID=A0A239M7W8_9BACT|nr:hypothetical protein [Granulicella rosea]SNT38213.1 hypothetical protein SAMN05421770_11038 [Granulicella rosea]
MYFSKPYYELWCPVRTSPVDSKFSTDGHPIVIQNTLSLISEAGTVLNLLGLDGADPETSPQTVDGDVWRGGGIFLLGNEDTAPVAPLAIEYFVMDGLTLQGNRSRTGDWDVTDKGFWIQDSTVGRLSLVNGGIWGFKGELLYTGGEQVFTFLFMDNFYAHTTDGDVLNGTGCGSRFYISKSCRFGNGYQAMEGWGGSGGSFLGGVFYDCEKAGTLWGGIPSGISAAYNFPTRPADGVLPWCNLDIEIDNCGTWYPGPWLRGKVKLTDTNVAFDCGQYGFLSDIQLDLDLTADKTANAQIGIYGPPDLVTPLYEGSSDYQQPMADIQLRIRAGLTAEAAAAGISLDAPVTWSGIFSTTNPVDVRLESACLWLTPHSDPGWVNAPLVTLQNFAAAGYASAPLAAAPTLNTLNTALASHIALVADAAGDYICTLATSAATTGPSGATTVGVVPGQKVKIENSYPMTVTFTTDGNQKIPGGSLTLNPGDYAIFEYVTLWSLGSYWVVVQSQLS